MATLALIPVEEYLATSYRPDRDYVDGEVLERTLGETPHSGLQGFFQTLFSNNRNLWGLRAFPEQRVQVSPTRFRVPDICALRPEGPPGGILRTPPLICIEVLSPEDSLGGMAERVEDYLNFGVEHVWLVDPVRQRAWTADTGGFHPEQVAFAIAGTPVRIELAELWAELNEIAAGR